LGLIGFGGPAAHVALMRRQIVKRRGWLSEERFFRMFAACNLIPGPSSTELAIFLGYRRAGWRAMLLAGGLFILPAMLIMLAIAWVYVRWGSTSTGSAILYGVRPVIVAVVVWALLDLARRVLSRKLLLVAGLIVFGLALLNANPILLLFATGLALALLELRSRWPSQIAPLLLPLGAVGAITRAGSENLPLLFLTFLKIGAVSYGSGYVLLEFLHTDFVQSLHWLNDKQLFDAVAIGQATPGPVFTTATFLGYLFADMPGALLATVGIFLPGFLFVPFLDRVVDAVQRLSWLQAFLEGANAAVLGLIAAVAVTAGKTSLVDPVTAVIAVVALLVLQRWPLSSPALVVAGALVGILAKGAL
jgi:chromate transporter